MLEDGRQLPRAQRQVRIVKVDRLARVQRAIERRQAVVVKQRQRDEPTHVEVVGRIDDVTAVDVANRLRKTGRTRRMQDVAAGVGLEFEVQTDIEVEDLSRLVVLAQQRRFDRIERSDAVDLGLICRGIDHVAAAGLLEQAADRLRAQPGRKQQHRKTEPSERELRDQVVEVTQRQQCDDSLRRVALAIAEQLAIVMGGAGRVLVELTGRVHDVTVRLFTLRVGGDWNVWPGFRPHPQQFVESPRFLCRRRAHRQRSLLISHG